MQRIALITVLMFTFGNVGAAIAQDRVVSSATSESAKIISDAVSGAAKDAAKERKKADEMKETTDMKKKSMDAEGAAKMKMKEKMK